MHTNPETLALLALGEDIGDLDRAHVAECAECTAELADLTRLVGIGRSSGSAPQLETPPAYVWDRTAAQLGLSGATPQAATAAAGPAAVGSASALEDVTGSTRTEAVDPRRRRGRQVLALVLAAAIALVAGFVLGDRLGRPDPAQTVAETRLEALPTWPGSTGDARVEVRPDGSRVLVLSMSTPRPVDGTREVWLINRTLSDMRALGYLTGTETTLPIPENLDLSQFAVVDVSREPFDDPDRSHSSDSIVRGTLGS